MVFTYVLSELLQPYKLFIAEKRTFSFSHVTLNEATFPSDLQPLAGYQIRQIEPLNHRLVAMFVLSRLTFSVAIVLARIHPSTSLPPTQTALNAKNANVCRDQSKSSDEFDQHWRYSIIDCRIEPYQVNRNIHALETRETLNSIVYRTSTSFKFFDVINEKFVLRREMPRNDVVDDKIEALERINPSQFFFGI